MYKAVVIGAGPGGYTCAIRIAQLGGQVALVERDLIGGICVNWGCTPSKAMITSAKIMHTVATANEYGIEVNAPQVNFAKVAERRDRVIAEGRAEIRRLLERAGVEIIAGEAHVTGKNSVEVNGNTLETENIVLATGSEPLIPGFLQKEDASIVNSNDLITIKELPQELTIIGGGIIGLEFATIFANLGTKVRIVELLDRCLANFDSEISDAITKELQARGVEIWTGHKVLDISNGLIKVEKVATNEQFEIHSALNLIAIGRKAVIHSPELEAMGIAHTPKGIGINTKLQTNIENVYAIGDATGQSILAHVAIQQGIIAAENMFGANREISYEVIPAVVYSLPEVATVGTVPTDLNGIKIVKYPFTANLRAHIEGHTTGFVKLWYSETEKRLMAVQMLGDMVGEVIQAYADIIALRLDVEQVAKTIHAHPTYDEIVRNSLEHLLGRAIEYRED